MLSDLFKYIRQVMRIGFAFWGHGAASATLVSAAITLLIAFLATVSLQIVIAFDSGVFFASLLILWFLFCIFLAAPFRIWRADQVQLQFLADAPHIEIDEIEERTEPHSADGAAERTMYLIVRNSSKTETLKNCLVKLIDWKDEYGNTSAFPEIALRTFYQKPPRPAGPFFLRPGDQKRIAVATLDEKDAEAEIELGYAEYQGYRPFLPSDQRSHLTIRALGDRGPPVTRRYILYREKVADNTHRLRMTESDRAAS